MTVLGIRDVSHHDVDRGDTDVARSLLVIAKATQGVTFVDPSYGYWLGKGRPTAAYHCVEPASHGAILTQVSHALNTIGKTRPAMADIETWQDSGGVNLRWPSFDEAYAWCRSYLAAGGNLRAAYIPRWFWQGKWGGRSLKPFADLGLFLVSSSYTTYSDTGPGWTAYGDMTPRQWQYADSPHDLNAIKASATDALAQWGFTGGSFMSNADDLYAALQDPRVAGLMAALPWQYAGRGFTVPGVDNPTSLGALNAAAHAAQAGDTTPALAALASKVDALTAAVVAITQGGASIDTAAVLAKIDQAAAAESATVAALQAQLAAAAHAQAAALDGTAAAQ